LLRRRVTGPAQARALPPFYPQMQTTTFSVWREPWLPWMADGARRFDRCVVEFGAIAGLRRRPRIYYFAKSSRRTTISRT